MESCRLGPFRDRGGRDQAVFLDRDGILNEMVVDGAAARPPRSTHEVRITAEARAGVQRLQARGHLLLVVTNQPDVRRGSLALADAMEVTSAVVDSLGLDDAYLCPHDQRDGCECRKPRAGMLVRAREDWAIDLTRAWLIGDRWVDVAAGIAAGARTLLLEGPDSWAPSGGVDAPPDLHPDRVFPTLRKCVDHLLTAEDQR